MNTLTALVGILTTIMLGWMLFVGRGILLPLVIAMLLSTMLSPVVVRLARWKIPSWATVIALVVALFLGVTRVAVLLKDNLESFFASIAANDGGANGGAVTAGGRLDPFSSQASELAGGMRGAWGQIKAGLHGRIVDSGLPAEFADFIQQNLDDLDVKGVAANLLGGGVEFFQGLLLVVLYMLFIFAEQAVFRRKIVSAAGERGSDAARVLDTIGRGVQSYLGVKTVISLATGVICYAALLFLELPFALLFGLLAFLLNYIPVFGSIIAGVFPVTLALATSETLALPITVTAVYVSVNVVMAYLIEPKLFGRELNLSPLVVLVSVIVWTGLWGIPGTFLSVPLTATLQIILANIDHTRSVALLLSSGAAPPTRRRAPLPDPDDV